MKTIKMSTLIKIKMCTLRIFETQDDDYVNDRVVSANERAISHYIKDYTEEERLELLDTIEWTNNDCAGSLEKLGWKIIKER